ncbi:putative tRNA pseudouridine synthase Pus10 [Chenopodium quinoa]|uniref:putative tRNA pseudouridine synthase Pus10 n=1 Tax=Chenopodium quinoa TaxID=63459 RepID=UPI000B76F4F5|nr:putative tRNA pseudouridine synthase Pus10 [Chenopodium quinoa]
MALNNADEELRLLDDVLRSLPPPAVNYLLTLRVCPQCILRLFGKYGPIYTHYSRISTILSEVVAHQPSSDDPVLKESANEDGICSVCFGILQYVCVDEKQALVNRGCANDFAALIYELVKKDGHQADSFSLEVSIPPIIVENENAVRLSMKQKYSSEEWFQETLQSEAISVKDSLKLSIIEPLETLLGVKSGSSSFRVRLTYTSSEMPIKTDNGKENNQGSKKRKTGRSEPNENDFDLKQCAKNLLEAKPFRPSEKISACSLEVLCSSSPIYIGGRYLKYSRNVSQSRWIIDDERMGEASVEEIVGNSILPLCRGDNYKFHAAGREDIDVRMLGSGRPFLLEIQNPRMLPSELSLKEMEMKINSLEGKLVKVKNLKVVDEQVWTLMREGEAEKQKQYTALVWISRQLEDKDLVTLSLLKDLKLSQRTPVRVLHRRSPLEREKIIHSINIEKMSGSTQYFLLHLCTQAGTYIKEFVHGDLGRTYPSLGSILGCRAEILQLDVTDVKMDCFLTK